MQNTKKPSKAIIRSEFERIRKLRDGILRPEDIVEAARRADSPIYSLFEWDDSKAGHQYRLEQARGYIQVYRTTTKLVQKENKAYTIVTKTPEYIQQPSGDPGYVRTDEAIKGPDRLALLQREHAMAASQLARYLGILTDGGFEECAQMLQSAMDKVHTTITANVPSTQATVVAHRQASPGAASRGSARQGVAGKSHRRDSENAAK